MSLDEYFLEEFPLDHTTLANAQSEEVFLQCAFELTKETMAAVVFSFSVRTSASNRGLNRNQAILVGHLVRMMKLMRTLIRQISDGHGGDQQLAITRQFIDSAATVIYLLSDSGDESRFDSYVWDSLIAEREFLKDVKQQIALRDSPAWPIEDRIESSIQATYIAAGVSEDDIPARKNNNWPSAKQRIDLLSPTAYSAYRTGSNAVHGAFADLIKHHLIEKPDGFVPDLDPMGFKPQPLLAMSLMGLDAAASYLVKYFPDAAREAREKLTSIHDRLGEVDLHHEYYLER